MADADYCELCDLPLSQCVHGRPEPVPAPAPAPAPRVRTTSPRTARVPGTRAGSTPPARGAPRKWTAPEELRPFVLATLQDAEGELEVDVVFERLEERVGDLLRPGDRETNPQGEMRWRAAARKARKALLDEGLLEPAGPGVWRLSAAGRRAPVTPAP